MICSLPDQIGFANRVKGYIHQNSKHRGDDKRLAQPLQNHRERIVVNQPFHSSPLIMPQCKLLILRRNPHPIHRGFA